jgi:hypothetical protein
MRVCMLMQEEFLPLPVGVRELANFGHEQLTVNNEDAAMPPIGLSGTVSVVEGLPEDMANWLRDQVGIWVTDNPMLGAWQMVHVKEHFHCH